jgi:hypothetical protein
MQERIINWRRSKPYTVVIDPDTKLGEKLYRFRNIRPLDPIVHAEAGAIIHSIRSSLDVLACTLAARNGCQDSRSTYFPIGKSSADFLSKNFMEKIKRLSQVDRQVIIDLQPYPGGKGDTLCRLHEMDLTRKHRRLLNTFVSPRGVFLGGLQKATYTVPGRIEFDEEAVFITTPSTAPDGNPTVNLHVSFDEAGVPSNTDISQPIREFASAATAIINLFA